MIWLSALFRVSAVHVVARLTLGFLVALRKSVASEISSSAILTAEATQSRAGLLDGVRLGKHRLVRLVGWYIVLVF